MITSAAFWKALTAKGNYVKANAEWHDWHIRQAGVLPELEWPLETFLEQSDGNRSGVVAIYLRRFWEDNGTPVDDTPGDPLDGWREEIREFDGHLQSIATGKVTPDTGDSNGSKSGDKWVSPGRLVCTWPNLDQTAQLVLFVMAAHGDNKGENIFVSQSTIADYLGFTSAEPVRRAYRRLEKVGAITRTQKPNQHKPGTYRINRGSRVV